MLRPSLSLCLLASFISAFFVFASGSPFAQGSGNPDTSYRQVVISEFGGPDVLSLVQHTDLPTPGQGEVRVRVLAAGVSFTDTMIRKGIYPGIEAELPYAPGYDLVGVVDAVGPGVTDLEVGQRVADLSIYGAYADYVIRPADGLVAVPDSVESTEAVSLILSYVTAYQMMHRVAEVQPGQTVLIHGASGGVGTALAQLGKVAGLKMFGTASTAKQDYVASLGVTPIDYKTETFETRVMEETNGRGVDVVFDAVGVDNFKRSYQVLNATGKLIPYGFYTSSANADAGPSLGALGAFLQLLWFQFTSNTFSDGAEVAGMYSIASLRDAQPEWFKEDLGALFALLANGEIKPNLWAVLSLEDAALAHQHFEDGNIQGKIVLELAKGPDQSLAVLVEGTGTYSRPVSTDSALGQQFFDQGLRLSWGYYFPSAIASHQEALRHDDHPMFHWGVATAIAPNPNSRNFNSPDDPTGEGLKAITRAVERKDRATELEQALIDAVYVRYNADAIPDQAERDQAYMAAIGELLRKYPDDPDIAAFYADAYMSMTAWDYWDKAGNARPGTDDAARVLEESLARHPNHPGTNHLYIHLIEASPMPERALASADRLAGLMPNAGHMVHMPGHIYLRVGQYDKAILTNERSVRVDDVFAEAWGDRAVPFWASTNSSFTNHRGHSLSFVRYAAALQGNYALAVDAARRMGSGWRQQVSEWLVHKRFAKWDTLLALNSDRTETPYRDAMLAYVQGSAYANTGALDQAKRSLATLRGIMKDERDTLSRGRINPQSALLDIAAAGLDGEIKHASGDVDGAVTAFEDAVQKELALKYMEPPSWVLPMRHYLGDALLEAGRAEEAEQVFRDDLAWAQNNGRGLYGLWQSLMAQGKADEAATVEAQFKQAWQSADTALTTARF